MKPAPAAPAPVHRCRRRSRARGGFTLIELLVVIAIIVVLIGILVPVVGKVRSAARVAAVQSQITQIQGAVDRYQQDFKAPPGPIPNAAHGAGVTTVFVPDGSVELLNVTGNENMVLGLFGGLANDGGVIGFYPAQVGRGPMSLNVANPKRYESYLEPTNLSPAGVGYGDDAWPAADRGLAWDSPIPELLDTFSDPMPILYLRARRGAGTASSPNPIIAAAADAMDVDSQYHVNHIRGYTATGGGGESIGVGREYDTHGLRDATVGATFQDANTPPYDAFPYFLNPSTNEARQKDGYILISAGADRTYGTEDDITNFGSVLP